MSCLKLFPLFLVTLVVNQWIAFGEADPVVRILDTPGTEDVSYIKALEEKALEVYMQQHKYLTVEDVPDKIVGGVDAAEGEAPFQAQLFRKSWFKSSFLCGGSLISNRTVLTAGHCVSYFFSYRIRYGSNSRESSPFPELKLKNIKLHPKFDLSTVQNDIALFNLEQPIQPGANVRAIDLQTTELAEQTNMTLFGFGLTNGMGNQPAKKLQKTELQTIGEAECADYIQKLGITKTAGMICASAPDRSACNGDSGGPLVVTATGLQAGVVSFGTRFCPPGSINVYTNVSHYIDWIKDNMEV